MTSWSCYLAIFCVVGVVNMTNVVTNVVDVVANMMNVATAVQSARRLDVEVEFFSEFRSVLTTCLEEKQVGQRRDQGGRILLVSFAEYE